MTRNAGLILEIIERSHGHPTAEQIYLTLKEHHIKIALATVYNNLNALYAAGRIRKLSVEGQADRYDKALRHDHLICDGCGRLVDITLEDLTARFQQAIPGGILSYDLNIHYLCPDCRDRKRRSPSEQPTGC